MDPGRAHNPFSSCYVEPARGGYLFPPGQSLRQVMETLERSGWRGELKGPHGAGKSTLMYDLDGALQDKNVPVARWFCNNENRCWPCGWWADVRRCRVLLIDGGEALAPGLLVAIRLLTRALGRGLVITSHRRRGLGAMIEVHPDADLLVQKVRHLLRKSDLDAASVERFAQRASALVQLYNGNGRDVLFDLYMAHEDE